MNNIFVRFFEGLSQGGDLPAFWGLSSESFSYHELDLKIEAYCNTILDVIGNAKDLVAILSTRNSYNPIIILSVIKSGKVYLPIDPANPFYRIGHMLNESKPRALIVEDSLLAMFEQEEIKLRYNKRFKLDAKYTILLNDYEAESYHKDVVQVLYTSGSTGFPKAVVHTYNSVGWFIEWCMSAFASARGGRIMAVAPTSFDLSVFDIFFSLMSRSCLVIPSDEQVSNARIMTQLIEDCRINLIYSTPSFFKFLIENPKAANHSYAHLRYVLLAGEPLLWQLLHKLREHYKAANFFNLYGPTESNVCCYYTVDFAEEKKYGASVPIGQPCTGLDVQPITVGQNLYNLHVAGPSLFAGYLQEESSTCHHAYNTKDLVSIQNHQLVFEERADRMIKRNGYRIEPAEVENCIKLLDGITGVIVTEVNTVEKMLLIACIETQITYSPLQVKMHCLAHLPRYFLPDHIIFFEVFPLNSNFKPDLKKILINYY